MPELGNKHECYSCGAKFYDLGRAEAVCPKCGANQKDAKKQETHTESAHAKRRRREEVVRPANDEEEDLAPAGDDDFSDDDLVTPESGGADVDEESEEDDDDLEDED